MNFTPHQGWMYSAAEILTRLREMLDAKETTQAAIGKVIGIAQANVSTFWTPGRNGKLRQLKWDEALKLSESFGIPLNEGDHVADPINDIVPPAPVLADVLEVAFAKLVPDREFPREVMDAMGLAFRHTLLEFADGGWDNLDPEKTKMAARVAARQVPLQ